MKKFRFDKIYKEFFVLPTFGFTWRNKEHKLYIAIAWLCWGFSIGCFKNKEE